MNNEHLNRRATDVQYGESISFTPREIVSELDRYIIGQEKAKKAVAIALRNRWRRQQLPTHMRDEITPKNILMVGQTGVGKTEIARRLAKLCKAPFIKIESTKFTEIGYVGRDVEQIIRDLADVAYINLKKNVQMQHRSHAESKAISIILDIVTGPSSSSETRDKYRQEIIQGKMNDKEIEVELSDKNPGSMDFGHGHSGGMQMSMFNVADLLKNVTSKTKKKTMTIKDAIEALIEDISENMLDQEKLTSNVKSIVEQNGIVFIDEIDKICSHPDHRQSDVSREGVQRDLLPLIEGTTVSTKYGFINTDHILFIASGAFQVVQPSDLLPELQGRLPIRVISLYTSSILLKKLSFHKAR
jgi:ATP-dependent HslUV protease ATP-binding subunit HslU